MVLKLILASAAVALTTTTASRSSSDLNVIVLAQKRPDHVSNLLASLDAASYRPDAVVDVEIHVDALPAVTFWARPDPAAAAGRAAVVETAAAWVQTWPRGAARVVDGRNWKGIRRAWLDCYDPGVSGDELGRVVIIEDDIELSPAWYEYLLAATAATQNVPGVAGVSLQRQASRLDAYASELGDTKAKATALKPLKLPKRDGVYLFGHVGSWGFAPEPKVWEAFLDWMAEREDDFDADAHFSVGADGEPWSARRPGYRESVVSRWYRGLVQNGRGESFGRSTPDSMWTAHFDAFCAERGLATLHARVDKNKAAFATSHRADGAHYTGINTPDASLVTLAQWRGGLQTRLFPAVARADGSVSETTAIPRVDLTGRELDETRAAAALRRFADHYGASASPGWRARFDAAIGRNRLGLPVDAVPGRRLFAAGVDEDIQWTTAGGWGAISPEQQSTAALYGGLQHGYAPFDDVTQERALCILKDKRVAIVGDSITRYFAFVLNYFLKTGEIALDFPSDGKWGGAKRKDDGFWRGSKYFDEGNIWTEGVYSTTASHRQVITQSTGGVETAFYFIQKTWYEPLEQLAPELKRDFDVLVANSAWWDIQKEPGCQYEAMFQTPSCLERYEKQLQNMASDLLEAFQGKGKAGIYRTANCCGGTSGGDKRRNGAIAVAAMNSVATTLFANRNVAVMDVEDTANPANVGGGDKDPDGRTFDGGHPRPAIYYGWVQHFLNKAARELDRESCFATDEPTASPTTKPPTLRPTPKPTAEPGSQCANGVRDGSESDVDCGGDECGPCDAGGACVVDRDCEGGLGCAAGVCSAPPSPEPSARPSLEPSQTPTDRAPRPTRGPDETDDGGGGGGNDDGYDGPPVRPDANLGGCGNYSRSNNDGISYARDGKLFDLEDQLFGVCPSAGQRLLLAVALGVVLATILAVAYTRSRADVAYRPYASRGSPLKEETKEKEPSPPKTRPGGRPGIEHELSGAALHVLKQMEKRETKGAPTLDKITEDAPVDENATARRSLAGSVRGGGGHHHPATRTSQSTFSTRLALGAGSQRERTSRYSEYHTGRGQPAAVSSVAFSLYDGGDSDDSELEDEDAVADAEAPAPPRKRAGAKTVAACLAAFQLGLLLVLAEIGDSRMPAGYIPAGTVVETENIDLWTFIMLSLAFASLWCLRSVASEADPAAACFLSRAQANEWKGWMQVAFVAYHYTNAQDVYVPIRWCVSAYVWLTGFGNGVYFWASADFSAKRFLQQIWRMNFLCALLALATNTAWIDYYFVALATVHFVLIFLCLGATRLLGKYVFRGWPTPDRKLGREACDAEKAVGWLLLVVLTCLLWVPPQLNNMQRNSAPKTPYDYVFQTWLKDINHHTANYFWTRTRMDYLSSIHGLLFAAVYARFRDWWPKASLALRAPCYAVASALFAVAVYVAKMPKYCCNSGADYRSVNAYVGTLWIPLYLLLRNSTPWLMHRVSAPMEWIGMHSLEFYLLQFHVFLTRKSQMILYIIPKESWAYTNMIIVGFIYVCLCVKALELTNVVRGVVWRCTRLKVGLCAAWCVTFYAIFEGYFKDTSHPCDGASWGVWWAFAVVAAAFLCAWTFLDLKA